MFDALAGILGIALSTTPIPAHAAQDGPVLAPPADTRPSGAVVVAPSEDTPPLASPEGRSQLRRLFRPRTRGTPNYPAAAPGPVASSRLSEPARSIGSEPPNSMTPSPVFGSDPLGLEPLPPDLELLPAGPAATAEAAPARPIAPAAEARSAGLPEPIGLEILPEYDDAPPLLGGNEVPGGDDATIGGLPDPFTASPPSETPGDRPRSPSSGSNRADRDDDDDDPDDESDRLFERDLRKSLTSRLGRQARDVDVRVRGESIDVRVNVNFFWNRRAIRRAIESMPDLAGYDLSIDTY